MSRRLALLAGLLVAVGLAPSLLGQQGVPPVMPLGEVRVGDRGVGYTVIRGTVPEAFDVEILGILDDVFPKLDLIVARLTGLDLERSGVAAGMSGSPVYIGDRLVGAVAYRLIDSGHEAIAGIVPIEAMLELKERNRAETAVRSAMPAADMFAAATALLMGGDVDGDWVGGAQLGEGISRIATPVSLGGFSPELTARLRPLLERFGWTVVNGGSSSQSMLSEASLVAGGAIGVHLVRGDINVTATGTITYRSGDTLLAFGHPFMQGGAVDFPLVGAEVVTVLSSRAASQKLSATGTEILGAVRQDRLPGVLGVIGATPRMIPVHLDLGGAAQGQSVDFEVVADPLLTPLYVFFGLINAVQQLESVYGEGSIDFEAEVGFADGHGPVRFGDLFGDHQQAVVSVASWLSGLYGSIENNEFEAVRVASINARADFIPGRRRARIERVWATARTAHPGETIRLTAVLRPFRGPATTREIAVTIPPGTLPGRVTITLGDAATYRRVMDASGAAGPAPVNVDGLLELLGDLPRNDRLYALITRSAAGATVAGQPMPALPPSVRAILDSAVSEADRSRLQEILLRQDYLDMDAVVQGSGAVNVEILGR